MNTLTGFPSFGSMSPSEVQRMVEQSGNPLPPFPFAAAADGESLPFSPPPFSMQASVDQQTSSSRNRDPAITSLLFAQSVLMTQFLPSLTYPSIEQRQTTNPDDDNALFPPPPDDYRSNDAAMEAYILEQYGSIWHHCGTYEKGKGGG